jgi:hypothetical protein
LYNASAVQLAREDHRAGDRRLRGCANRTAAQPYYLEVSAYSTYTGNYTVTATPINDDCPIPSTATGCAWSNLATPITKSIEIAGDTDWIKFVPTASGTWTFTSSKPANSPLFDPVGTLHNASGTQLARDDDGAGDRQFRVQASLTAGQTYYLEVSAYNTYTGNYTVTATRQ